MSLKLNNMKRGRKPKLQLLEEQHKGTELSIKEFFNFRNLAFSKHVPFNCQINHNSILVECDNKDFMLSIGY